MLQPDQLLLGFNNSVAFSYILFALVVRLNAREPAKSLDLALALLLRSKTTLVPSGYNINWPFSHSALGIPGVLTVAFFVAHTL